MIRLANTQHHYGATAIALHWLMAALIITLVLLGIYMVRLPDVGFDAKKIILILVHKQMGMLALALGAVRLAWRQLNPLPSLAATLPEWQQVAAIFVHLCFYALIIALPIIGWVMSSAAGIPVSFLGLFTLPDFVPYGPIFIRAAAANPRLAWLPHGGVHRHSCRRPAAASFSASGRNLAEDAVAVGFLSRRSARRVQHELRGLSQSLGQRVIGRDDAGIGSRLPHRLLHRKVAACNGLAGSAEQLEAKRQPQHRRAYCVILYQLQNLGAERIIGGPDSGGIRMARKKPVCCSVCTSSGWIICPGLSAHSWSLK